MRELFDSGAEGSRWGKRADMQFVDNQVAEWRALPVRVAPPIMSWVDDDRKVMYALDLRA